MAISKAELLKAKMEKQGKSPFELGSTPMVETRTPEVVDPAAPQVKEIKNKRIQILTYGSLVEQMDSYAARMGLSRAEVFEAAVASFLNQHDK